MRSFPIRNQYHKKAAIVLQLKIQLIRFAPLIFPPILTEFRMPFPGKPGYYSLLKNQVMKKIRLITKNENVQAGLVIAGFIIIFSLLAIFFMGK